MFEVLGYKSDRFGVIRALHSPAAQTFCQFHNMNHKFRYEEGQISQNKNAEHGVLIAWHTGKTSESG